jgi:RNA polymerase sigma-70 factor (ECF subfamily)
MNPFDQELTALLPRLRRFAAVLAGSQADGDDLMQSALEKALVQKHQFQPGTRLDAWMFRIIRNQMIDGYRARRRRPTTDLDDAAHVVGDDGAHTAEQRLLLAQTRIAMDALPAEQREVLALVAIDGLSYREAADILDIPIGTVMSRLARARGAVSMAVLGHKQGLNA